MNTYTNQPVNRPSKSARAAERRTTTAAILLTFAIIFTLATIKRLIGQNTGDDLSGAAALAYAAVHTVGTEETDDFIITDIIA